jgi:two-component system response regulator AtoC
MAHVLVVDDEEGLRTFLGETLELDSHEVSQAADGRQAIDLLETRGYDLVISDLKMPHVDGMELLRWLRAEQPEVELVLLTAHGDVRTAVEAMRLGAFDFLQKPIGSPAELRLVARRALERRQLRAFRAGARRSAGKAEPLLTWGAKAMQPVVGALQKVAKTNATVLLVGQSGTGKEVAARAVHGWSARAEGPFIAVNCAAISEQLLESELFGHEKGAFTGAAAQRQGLIELAQEGTFFLDEVAELKLELQAKLLRVLQERQFQRVGGTRTLEADVRWVAATNRDLRKEIAEGRFREDLYHRLAVFPVVLPPLRDRREDIGPLATTLLAAIGAEMGRADLALSPAALAKLERAAWPGNVRELRNALERAAIIAEGEAIEEDDLWLHDQPVGPLSLVAAETATSGQSARDGSLAALERVAIAEALEKCGGNRKQAAERLGIGVRTLYEKLKRYAIG